MKGLQEAGRKPTRSSICAMSAAALCCLVPQPKAGARAETTTGPVFGTDAETRAIATGAELFQAMGLVGVPKPKPAGEREMDEQPLDSIFDKGSLTDLVGENPTVLYRVVVNGTPLPDPMIVPWTRGAVVIRERYELAVDLLSKGELDDARHELLGIVTESPDSEYGRQSREILAKIKELETPAEAPELVQPTPTPAPEIQVHPNVRVGTALVDRTNPGRSRVMIGDRAYGPGDTIRNFANHRIVEIRDDAVVFEVEVQGTVKQIPVPAPRPGSPTRE